ncbi:MAG: NAD(P)-binding domain-containing protein [Sulfurimonas sp.]|uniref:NAD(P)-binding domain-containing protein n=1 Tax=Sulfurimonas sp. TaxID=2022749 RepID=UPI002628FC02|nr:NAD(P)-binding domain-containing protein [Sulfurimonas sp.]MCW8896226.1 NAD(P)-binding domain-containing protein [Sulfurimonas sp.]MCW8954053.1 NAD(P)-binding domain-containing protein [Sulfurimonas sp.]MCW9068329.1 NAD(P)-binding domain-containing protein [Sulfurimonas sp.]
MSHIYNLAIIGAGPAGIATAVESYLQGIRDIVLLEKDENHNSTIRKYYKDNKRVDKDWKGQKVELDGRIYFVDGTKETTLDFFDEILENHSVELQTHVEVQSIQKQEGCFEVFMAGKSIKAKHVVVTIGRMGKPNKPSYKIPAGIKKKIGYTLDGCDEGEKILVVGGGDSAIEYAVDLSEKNEVSICYRRETFRRANPTNQRDIANAIMHKEVEPILGIDIDSLEDEDGKVKVIFTQGETQIFDRVIYAIGGTTPSSFLASAGIQEEDGKPVHDDNYETNIEGLFVAGDITQESGGSIALGLNHGYAIACFIQQKNKI